MSCEIFEKSYIDLDPFFENFASIRINFGVPWATPSGHRTGLPIIMSRQISRWNVKIERC